jgi:hypothetical protein
MKKVILLVLLVILLVLFLCWNRRSRREVPVERKSPRSFTSLGQAKVNFILSEDGTLVSYSIVVPKNERKVETIFFSVGDQRVKEIAIVNSTLTDDLILHGLWRQKDPNPFTPELAEQLKQGQLRVEVKFAE